MSVKQQSSTIFEIISTCFYFSPPFFFFGPLPKNCLCTSIHQASPPSAPSSAGWGGRRALIEAAGAVQSTENSHGYHCFNATTVVGACLSIQLISKCQQCAGHSERPGDSGVNQTDRIPAILASYQQGRTETAEDIVDNLIVGGAIREKCRMCVNVSYGMNEYSSSQDAALEQQGKMQLFLKIYCF